MGIRILCTGDIHIGRRSSRVTEAFTTADAWGAIVETAIQREVNLWADHIDGADLWSLIPDVDALVTLRFRSDNIEALDEHVRQEGFITVLQPLTDEMIRARAFSATRDALDGGILHDPEVDSLLASLTGVSPAVAD